jgi:hemolysin activation/secretion protein
LGSDFNYEQFFASYNKYIPIGDKMVIATRASLCHTSDRVPFFDLCLFGTNSDLRGYIGGQYRDRNLLATQVEYRWRFYKRFGMVAFAGIGSVAPKIDEFKIDDILPSAGFGLRFLASKDHRLNVGIDYAFGEDSEALYFRIGEAF